MKNQMFTMKFVLPQVANGTDKGAYSMVTSIIVCHVFLPMQLGKLNPTVYFLFHSRTLKGLLYGLSKPTFDVTTGYPLL